MKMISRVADETMILAVNPPEGFDPIVSNSTFGWEVGPFFEKTVEGLAVQRGFRVMERHLNKHSICHEGMLMTFADILIASAVMKRVAPPFVTVKLAADFVGTAPLGSWVQGEAKAFGVSDGFVSVSGQITADGDPVATINSIFKAFKTS
jgi:acyl-coenzyme A thioesterase PaaI-like protein